MKAPAAGLALAIVCLEAAVASAHTRSVSYSLWDFRSDGGRVELRLPAIELTRFPGGLAAPAYFAANLSLVAGGETCGPTTPVRVDSAPAGWVIFRWLVECRGPGPRSIRSSLFSGVTSTHVHFARVTGVDREVRERFLTESDPIWRLDVPPTSTGSVGSAGEAIARYVGLGVAHILSGWDHLAFLFALLLLAGSLREVTILVSGFTVAHSLTLGLAAFGVIRPEPAAVEVLIGFSIALVAAENVWLLGERDRAIPVACVATLLAATVLSALGFGGLPWLAWLGLVVFSSCHFGLLAIEDRPARLRAAIAFAFGLVHGFGFAGALMEIELPTSRLLPALFGFNTGVELGQLGVVVVVWPILLALARHSQEVHRRFAEVGSAAILALGVFWIVTRAWG